MFKTKKEAVKFKVYCTLFAVIMVVLVLANRNIFDLIYLISIGILICMVLTKRLKK